MAVLDIVQGQSVQIPAIKLTDGNPLAGAVRATQGDTIAIELDQDAAGVIPPRVDSSCVLTWKSDGIQRACPILVRSKSNRALVVQVVIQERREAPRLRADVKLVYEIIPADRVSEAAEEVMAKINSMGEPVSESSRLLYGGKDDPIEQVKREIAAVRGALDVIMTKLDQLTALVASGEKARTAFKARRPLMVINCSSTGVGFVTDEDYEQGQYLRLHLTLCTAPQVEIDCLGVVVRSKRLEGSTDDPAVPRYDTGVRYTHIHESDREHLIHYLFKVQRRLLRDMKEARAEIA